MTRPLVWMRHAALALALIGGTISIGLALLVTFSVSSRATGFGGVPGDFELIEIVTALAVFSFLPFTQAQRGNIVVDSFSTRWPERARRMTDGIFDLVFAAVMAICAAQLWTGAGEAALNGSASMVLLLPLSPALYACAAMAGFLALVCIATALDRFGLST